MNYWFGHNYYFSPNSIPPYNLLLFFFSQQFCYIDVESALPLLHNSFPSLVASLSLSLSLFLCSGKFLWWYLQFSTITQSCLTLCDPVDCSTPGFPVHHQLPELTQTHVHWVGDAIQPSHPLSSPSPPAFNLPQNQGLFQWVSSSHQVAKVLELQLQHQSFQWIFRTDFL